MIKILVDTASDIDQSEAKSLGIEIIPMQVRFSDGSEYLDGINLSHTQFFEKLIESAELPKTSQINEYTFTEKFTELTSDGSQVLAIVISSKLSGTYNCASLAAKNFNGNVAVIDSLNACVGERILCQYAIRLVKEGKLSLSEIVSELNQKKSKIQVLALLDTLKYLRKGGRISSVTAFTGELLAIKPVVSIIKGEVKMVGKAIGSRKGNNLLDQLVDKCGGVDFDMPYTVAYSGLSDLCLKKYLADSKHLWQDKTDNIPVSMVGSTIGTHVGPGAIAVSFFAK